MKVLLLNGSSNLKGCTYTALEEIAKTLQEEGIDIEIFQIGAEPLRDCIGCGGCRKGNGCVFRDDCVNEFVEKKSFPHNRLSSKQMALYLAHQFIMRIQAAALCHF